MRLSRGIGIVAVGLIGIAALTDDSFGFGRGGGGGGGGRPGGGGGGARPAPVQRPAPQARPSPQPVARPQPAARPNPQPVARPQPASRPGTLPATGGSVVGPIGGALPGKSDRPSTGGGVPNGGLPIGGNGGRPATLPARPNGGEIGKGGVIGPGGNRPDGGRLPDGGNRLPHDGGLANYAKNANIGNKVNNGTINVNRNNVIAQGNNVRNNFGHYDCFRPNWWNRYPNAWRAAAWTTAGAVWAATTWAILSSYCSYPAQPVYYDYGSTVVYEGDQVYVNGDPVATQDQYAQQALTIADTGRAAQAPPQDDWKSLGVFGMVQGGESNANTLFQLAVNKAGVMRGNYYDALSDTTLPVYGQVDPKTQRAAWTVGDKKNVVYEAGIANLTQDQTTMLVHFGKDRTQQWTLVRLQDK